MPKQIMDRAASDNEYLHRDFHGALSSALIYLQDRFGSEAVREYLRHFAAGFYAPLRDDLRQRGLAAMAERLRALYEKEGADVKIEPGDGELIVRVGACPAVTHMRASGYEVSPLWHETISSVNEAICEGSLFAFELLHYDEQTGASTGRFYRPAAQGGDAR